ncbi:MAG: hypothetical protein MJY67_01385, partial [Bacteroidales bacterium]|nr:hypothetical protein [Bacteroidales bacterium]
SRLPVPIHEAMGGHSPQHEAGSLPTGANHGRHETPGGERVFDLTAPDSRAALTYAGQIRELGSRRVLRGSAPGIKGWEPADGLKKRG